MRLLLLTAAAAASISLTAAQLNKTVVTSAGMTCLSTPPPDPKRLCALHLETATSNAPSAGQNPACSGEQLLGFLTACPERGALSILANNTLTYNANLTDECWKQQCSVLDQFVSCARSILSKDTNNTDYQAAASYLVKQCAVRGVNVKVDVGSIGDPPSSAGREVGIPLACIVLGAVSVGVLV